MERPISPSVGAEIDAMIAGPFPALVTDIEAESVDFKTAFLAARFLMHPANATSDYAGNTYERETLETFGPIYGFRIDPALSALMSAVMKGIPVLQEKTFGQGPMETVLAYLDFLSQTPGLPTSYVAALGRVRDAHEAGFGDLVARVPGYWEDRAETRSFSASSASSTDNYLRLTGHVALSQYIDLHMGGHIPVRDWECAKHKEWAENDRLKQMEIERENRLWESDIRAIFSGGTDYMTVSEREAFGAIVGGK